ncbi:MAG: valine--tRNA ligase [Rhodospirillales bacterium]|nr:valine--tRNA ligase [Rhodospirillales bacterium]
MLDKTFNPDDVERRHYAAWEKMGAFACGHAPGAPPFAIVIPPPNVTGSLHMGHALNNTLQDILVRWRRMQGDDALWQPGTDHAGIATQMVVERQLSDEGKTRHDLGREAFIARVWDWKTRSGGTITAQLRRLGASCDWSRERFTMDEGLSRAVRKVFVDLHKQGLIHRAKRLVNWDPKLHTAISDLEVEQREGKGKLWYFRYPLEGGGHVTVATTRPETMLGDTGVAVHPDDERYKAIVGKMVVLPITGRKVPVVADAYADPAKGSGAVKVTPAHDFNDFEVGRRHNLPAINVLDQDARIISDQLTGDSLRYVAPNEYGVKIGPVTGPTLATDIGIPEEYRGLDRFVAREKVVAEMEFLGLLEKCEDNLMTIPYGDRSGVVIEPWLTDQWFVDAAKLAAPAIKAVEEGRTRFVPKSWENTYFEWMRNIQPWCISRQIWWGHQIPAWYDPEGNIYVELTEAEAHAQAEKRHGRKVALTRDEDVLDTWFSSALWPFSTLGWPDATPELARYYPTSVLVTGFDIIFFWVARMMMMGLHFMPDVPFRTVYIHALVRDEKGQKMSKSKGNVIDPLDLIGKFGADSLRFTLAALAVQGRDVKLSEARVEGYRNFATKIWNAARFCEMNGCLPQKGFDPASVRLTLNRWIVGKTAEAVAGVNEALEQFKFNEAAGAIYHFTWGTFCDWYLEFIKPVLQDENADPAARAETRAAAAWALDQILRVLHPIMPFITSELWQRLDAARAGPLHAEKWPEISVGLRDPASEAEADWLVEIISAVRAVRSEMNVPAAAKMALRHRGASAATAARLGRYADLIHRLARIEIIEPSQGADKGAVQVVVGEATFALPLAGIIDMAAEKARLEKEIVRIEGEIAKCDHKLANQAFVAKAPPEVVETERERLAEARLLRERVRDARARLMAAM